MWFSHLSPREATVVKNAKRKAAMSDKSRRKPGVFRRLSFRRRRSRSPSTTEKESSVASHDPPSPIRRPYPPNPAPPSPTPTVTTTTISRSTSTSTLDIMTTADREGNGPQEDAVEKSDHHCPENPSQATAQCTAAPGDFDDGPEPEKQDSHHESNGSEANGSPPPSTNTSTSDSSSELTNEGTSSKVHRRTDVDLNRVLLSHLECPVCYQPMAPPIRQCLHGHSVCSRCEARLARCPTCRGSFLPAPNATLNAIALAVRLPCRHPGCRAHLHLTDKARHEDHCSYREYHCTHNKQRCSWKGTLAKLMEHTLSTHALETSFVSLNQYVDISYTYSRTRPFEVSNLDGGVNRVSKTVLLVESAPDVVSASKNTKKVVQNDKAKEDKGDKKEDKREYKKEDKKEVKKEDKMESISVVPRALFRFHLRFDASRVLLQAVLQYVGPPANSVLFRYKVSLASRDGSFKLSVWSEATSEEVVDEAVADGKVLRVDGAAFRHVIDENGRFLVRLKVVVGRLPFHSTDGRRGDEESA